MHAFVNYDLSNFGSDLPSATIRNSIRTDKSFDIFPKQTPKILFLLQIQYSFQTDYLSVARVGEKEPSTGPTLWHRLPCMRN